MTKTAVESSHGVWPRKKFWLIVAVLWLEAVVAVSIGLEIKQLHTPVRDWLIRTMQLLGK